MEKHQITFEEMIFRYLENENMPLSARQISEQLGFTKASILIALDKLKRNDEIIEIGNPPKLYYIVKRKPTENDLSNMHFEIAKETVKAKISYDDLADKVEMVDKNINVLYANIISLMSIFVAIFALITVNANMVFNLTTENMSEIFWGIIKVNGFVVICIITMLWGVRVIIINPLIKRKGEKVREV